jgi:transmembrane 9 superfamily protein 2/4
MAAVTLTFALLGFMSPANRGGLLTSLLLLFVFMGTPHSTTVGNTQAHTEAGCEESWTPCLHAPANRCLGRRAGSVAGYCSARLYKFFNGKNWKQSTILTATLFPGTPRRPGHITHHLQPPDRIYLSSPSVFSPQV